MILLHEYAQQRRIVAAGKSLKINDKAALLKGLTEKLPGIDKGSQFSLIKMAANKHNPRLIAAA